MILTLIEHNKDFIAEEAIIYIKDKYPNFKFDYELLRRDIHMIVEAK